MPIGPKERRRLPYLSGMLDSDIGGLVRVRAQGNLLGRSKRTGGRNFGDAWNRLMSE